MTIVSAAVFIVIVALVVIAINKFVPMPANFAWLFNAVVGIGVILVVLDGFGLINIPVRFK